MGDCLREAYLLKRMQDDGEDLIVLHKKQKETTDKLRALSILFNAIVIMLLLIIFGVNI